MTKPLFNFDAEFKLGIDAIDQEHVKLADIFDRVHTLLNEGKRDEARQYFVETLSNYVHEHFANEEKFLAEIVYPQPDEHKKLHANFKQTIRDWKPLVESSDELAFRKTLNDTFTWIIAHIGKTDRRYAKFLLSQDAGMPNILSVSE